MAIEMTIPMVTWNRRMKPEGTNEYTWVPQDSEDIFKGKRVVLFALPGAFTPTCSTRHLPGYEAKYDEILKAKTYCWFTINTL